MDPITLEEFLAEVNRLGVSTNNGGALTVRELMIKWGLNERTVRKYLGLAKNLGLLKVTKVSRIAIDGKEYQAPAYSFIINNSKKSTKRSK